MTQKILNYIAIIIVVVLGLLGASIVRSYGRQVADSLEVPDLKLCSLTVVDCGVYEPIQLAQRGVRGIASYYDYILPSGWSSIGHNVAATRDWPRYSYLEVINAKTKTSVVVKTIDFGPDASVFPERIIDLSSHAFATIAPLHRGVISVIVRPYDQDL